MIKVLFSHLFYDSRRYANQAKIKGNTGYSADGHALYFQSTVWPYY